jgi:single-strand DNA-binding protein
VNVVVVAGRAGKDPEATKGNTKGAHFSMALSERYQDKATKEWKDRVTWVNIQVWGNFADFVMKHIRKGDKVLVHGKISVSEYNNKTYTNIVADAIEPEKYRKVEDQGQPSDEPAGRPSDEPADEDLPF